MFPSALDPMSRFRILREAEYPLNAWLLNTLRCQLSHDFAAGYHPADRFQSNLDKQAVDRVVADWIIGSHGTEQTLERLLPLAIRFGFGNVDPLRRHLLSQDRQNAFELAETITDAWYAILMQAPERTHHRFAQIYEQQAFHWETESLTPQTDRTRIAPSQSIRQQGR